jgi:hypothetical protein
MLTHSNWHLNRRSAHCAFEPCNKEFDGSCFHAADGRYYCSEECAVDAANSGLRRINKLAQRIA